MIWKLSAGDRNSDLNHLNVFHHESLAKLENPNLHHYCLFLYLPARLHIVKYCEKTNPCQIGVIFKKLHGTGHFLSELMQNLVSNSDTDCTNS